MREKRLTLILTFRTTTQAMAVEKHCIEQNLPGRVIPVPREITAGCGLSWKADPAERERLTVALTAAGLQWEAMYEIEI